MSDPTPDPIGVDREQAAVTADLFESYGNYAAEEITTGSDESWQARADAGSAYRTAGEWALLADPDDLERVFRLLRLAADHFRSTYGYAAFLRAVTGEPPQDPVADALRLLALNRPPDDRPGAPDVAPGQPTDTDPDGEDRWPGLAHPQQQAYLLLALAAAPVLPSRARSAVFAVCRNEGRRHEGHPVGAAGLPLWRYWRAADNLLHADLTALALDLLVPLDHRYTDAMTSAQSNAYLWAHAAAPVDVVDLDAVGLTVLAVRRFGVAAVRETVETGPMSPAMTSLVAHGIRLAEPDGDR